MLLWVLSLMFVIITKVRLSDQKETGDTYGYGGSSTALKKSR